MALNERVFDTGVENGELDITNHPVEETEQHIADESTEADRREERQEPDVPSQSVDDTEQDPPGEPTQMVNKKVPDIAASSVTSTELVVSLPVEVPPDDVLLRTQLLETAPRSNLRIEGVNEALGADVLNLYRGIDPQNAHESILARHIVVLSNTSMECYGKAGQCSDLAAREFNLKYAMKGSALITQLLETLAKLRAAPPPQAVMVGSVNVEAGGQAIVGNVQTEARRPATPGPEQRKDLKDPSRRT
jgi:hypothetical protein